MLPVPGHRPLQLQDGRHLSEDVPIAVAFQNPPAMLDRVVLAVIRRLVGQPNEQRMCLGKRDHPLQQLRAATLILGGHCPG